jgi:hypothetical protein
MYDAKNIDSEKVSFQLNHPNSTSFAIFGDTPKNIYSRDFPVTLSADTRFSDWWTVGITNVFYSDKSIHTSGV